MYSDNDPYDTAFWQNLESLIEKNGITVERPKNSAHPRYPDYIYPVDYGYINNTRSNDGAEIDVWIGAGDETKVTGLLATMDPEKGDAEIKVLIGCDASEQKAALQSSNRGSMSAVLIPRKEVVRSETN
jgi:inorganic pyrophosphatase